MNVYNKNENENMPTSNTLAEDDDHELDEEHELELTSEDTEQFARVAEQTRQPRTSEQVASRGPPEAFENQMQTHASFDAAKNERKQCRGNTRDRASKCS